MPLPVINVAVAEEAPSGPLRGGLDGELERAGVESIGGEAGVEFGWGAGHRDGGWIWSGSWNGCRDLLDGVWIGRNVGLNLWKGPPKKLDGKNFGAGTGGEGKVPQRS